MNSLQQMFPSLTLFSDLDWDLVTEEYRRDYGDISFPEYLQQKAMDGDCPPYLFELAFYELGRGEIQTLLEEGQPSQGVALNPAALFLSLEFDVSRMIKEAKSGQVDVIERPHVLCLFLDKEQKIQELELTHDDLSVLEFLEDGPKPDKSFLGKEHAPSFDKLHKLGLIFYNP